MINLLIEADRVELMTGEPHAVDVPRDNGGEQRVYRCPDCQVAVFSEYGRPRGVVRPRRHARRAPRVTPDVHIFTRSKVPWVVLPDSAPAFEEYYDTKALWPAESYARVRAALGRNPVCS